MIVALAPPAETFAAPERAFAHLGRRPRSPWRTTFARLLLPMMRPRRRLTASSCTVASTTLRSLAYSAFKAGWAESMLWQCAPMSLARQSTLGSALRNSSASRANLQPKATQNPADTQFHIDKSPKKLLACNQQRSNLLSPYPTLRAPRGTIPPGSTGQSRVHRCDQFSSSSLIMLPSHAIVSSRTVSNPALFSPHQTLRSLFAATTPFPADYSLAYLTASPLGSWVDLPGACASLGGQSSLPLLAASRRRAFGRQVGLSLLAAQGRSFGRVAWTELRRGPCLGAPASSRKKPLCLARTHWNPRQTVAWIGTHRNRQFPPWRVQEGLRKQRSSARCRLRSEPISAG